MWLVVFVIHGQQLVSYPTLGGSTEPFLGVVTEGSWSDKIIGL